MIPVIVAQITPMNPSGCLDCNSGVIALNNAIPAWTAGLSTAQNPVSVVDLFSGLSTGSDTSDGVLYSTSYGCREPEDCKCVICTSECYYQEFSGSVLLPLSLVTIDGADSEK
jgi:hypothetical protein